MKSAVVVCVSHLSRVQLCNPMDCSLPGSSVPGILQARTLDWIVMPSSIPTQEWKLHLLRSLALVLAPSGKPCSDLDLIKKGIGHLGSSAGKESACNAGNPGSIPAWGRSPGEGIDYPLQYSLASLVAPLVKKIHPQCGRAGFDPWVGKIPWRRVWQPTPVFLPGGCPWTDEPGGLQSMGLQRIGHNWVTKQSTKGHLSFICCCINLNGWHATF